MRSLLTITFILICSVGVIWLKAEPIQEWEKR